MHNWQTLRERFNPILISGYLGLFAIAAAGLLSLRLVVQRWQALFLLVAFTFLFSRPAKTTRGAHLLALFSTLTTIAILNIAMQAIVFNLLFFILSANVMLSLPVIHGLLWIAIFSGITTVNLGLTLGWQESLRFTLPFLAGYFFFGAFAGALQSARRARAQSEMLLKELQITHRRLNEYAARVEELTITAERARLAREMHDNIGHRLTVSAIQLEAAKKLLSQDPQRSANLLTNIHEQIQEALQDIRKTVGTLRQPIEMDLSLPQALERLCHTFEQASGLNIRLELPPQLVPLTQAQQITFYRAAQEGLTNIQKHARATQATLILRQQDSKLQMELTDNGIGYPTGQETTGFGLMSIRQRLEQIHGTIQLNNLPQGGARLLITCPLSPEESNG